MHLVLESQRFDYWEESLRLNSPYASPLTVTLFWSSIGKVCDHRIMKSMLDTNIPEFTFSEIKNDNTYWDLFHDVCNNKSAYSSLRPLESNAFRCFALLLEREEIINVLKQELNAVTAVSWLIDLNKVEHIDYLFSQSLSNNWKLDFTKSIDSGTHSRNVVKHAVGYGRYEICKLLIETDLFDINHVNDIGVTALLSCAITHVGYDAQHPLECENFKIFDLLLQQKDIDVSIVTANGDDIILSLYKARKDDYIDYLKEGVFEMRDRFQTLTFFVFCVFDDVCSHV